MKTTTETIYPRGSRQWRENHFTRARSRMYAQQQKGFFTIEDYNAFVENLNLARRRYNLEPFMTSSAMSLNTSMVSHNGENNGKYSSPDDPHGKIFGR